MTDEEVAQQEREIEKLVADVREKAIAEEREACAKIADSQAWSHAHRGFENGPELNSAAIAKAIRGRTLERGEAGR